MYPKWISVSEKFPPPDTWVLLVEVPDSIGVHVGQVDSEGRFWIWHAKDIWPSKPTHWMLPMSIPLPKEKKIRKEVDHGEM